MLSIYLDSYYCVRTAKGYFSESGSFNKVV